jgi:Zn-dependent oligopeptidase
LAANKALEDHEIESNMREDVYKVIRAVYDKTTAGDLKPEDYRLLQKMELEYRRNGLALSKDKRDELMKKKKRLAEICVDFAKNINEDKTKVSFTKEELEGLSDDFLKGLEKDGDKYIVTMKYPDLLPVMNQAKSEETRKIMDVTNGSRCSENVALLEEALKLRSEISHLLGNICSAF